MEESRQPGKIGLLFQQPVNTKQQQIKGLGRLGWSLRKIEAVTGGLRETISGYLTTAAILRTVCGPNARADDGVLVGAVRNATDEHTLRDASIQVSWPEWTIKGKKLATDIQTRVARSDSLGRYALCGIPAGSTLRALVFSDADSTGEIEVSVAAQGYAVRDFMLGIAAHEVISQSAADSSAGGTRVPRGRAAIRGLVRDPDGRPLRNALVHVIGSGGATRSAEDGQFVIRDVGAGTRTVEARLIGYSPQRIPVEFRETAEASATLVLPVRRVELDTVRVVAGRDIPFFVRSIERRARSGTGKMLSGDAVRERSTLWVTDALRGMNGLTVNGTAQGGGILMRDLSGRACIPFVYIDGIITQTNGEFTIDDFVSRANVAAVEVYARANLVPPEFNGGITGCGAIAVWSRFGTENISVLPTKSDRKRD